MIRQTTKRLIGIKYLFILIVMFGTCSSLMACEVDSVTLMAGATDEEAVDPGSESLDIPVGDKAFFYATCEVGENPDELDINWEFDLDGDGDYDDYSDTSAYDECYMAVDDWTYGVGHHADIKVQACLDDGKDNWAELSEEDYCDVTVVKIDKIQYDDPDTGYTDISDTMYVHKGTTVTFKAIKDPPSASWPSGKPVWGGSAGASGTGETKAVTFDTTSTSATDYKTVTAECGNTETVNVVVYEFEGTFQPDDPFTGRSLDRWGLEEEVDLEFTTTPTGITATQARGLEWTWSGAGELTNMGPDGTANYDARHVEAGVVFRLKIVAGASAGSSEFYWHDVIKPTGTRMTRKYMPGIHWHEYQKCTVGLSLYYWLNPTDVSFENLKFGEGECFATEVEGYYLKCEPP